MAKSLRDISPKGVKKSKTEPMDISDLNAASGNQDFAKKHKIEKHADRVGNDENPYSGNDEHYVLNSKSEKRHGNKKGDAEKIYEAKCNMTEAGTMCEVHGDKNCSVPEAGVGKRGLLPDKKKLNEVLTKKTPVSNVIDGFVHSKNKMFKGDSKNQRIKRALGAYYSIHKEDAEQIDELSKDAVGDYIKSGSSSAANLKTDAAYANMTGDDARANKNRDKARNRQAGIYTAVNKLTGRARVNANEEVDPYVKNLPPISADGSASPERLNKLASMAGSKPGKSSEPTQADREKGASFESGGKKKIKEDLAMPMLEGGKKKKTKKESGEDTPMRFPSGNVGDNDKSGVI